MKRLPRTFYNRNTVDVAIDLLGCEIVTNIDDFKTSGLIVETEAYRGPNDPACHAFGGLTQRNSVMFGPPGYMYVYFTYGNHHMINIICEPEGYPGGVLIRALDPMKGIEKMRERRGTEDLLNLCSGPGKLAKALGVRLIDNGSDLCDKKVYIKGPSEERSEIIASPRIGIGLKGHRKLWRFYINGNLNVSRSTKYIKENSYILFKARKRNFDLD